jgi:hypothetical protein
MGSEDMKVVETWTEIIHLIGVVLEIIGVIFTTAQFALVYRRQIPSVLLSSLWYGTVVRNLVKVNRYLGMSETTAEEHALLDLRGVALIVLGLSFQFISGTGRVLSATVFAKASSEIPMPFTSGGDILGWSGRHEDAILLVFLIIAPTIVIMLRGGAASASVLAAVGVAALLLTRLPDISLALFDLTAKLEHQTQQVQVTLAQLRNLGTVMGQF